MSRSRNNRRSLLKAASAVAASVPFISLIPRADAQAEKFDSGFGTATQAVKKSQTTNSKGAPYED
jgi:hypothetical protein